MAAKRRSAATAHYPDFLVRMKHKGKLRYRFTTIDGTKKLFPLGTSEFQAIQAALAYNAKHRGSTEFSLEETSKFGVTGARNRKDIFDKPLKEWLPIVIKRVENEESLSRHVFIRFKNECNTLEAALGDVFTKSLTLAHLNNFMNQYYGEDAKRNYNGKLSNLKKVFSYLADESAIDFNFMLNKKPKKVTKEDYKKSRLDLTVEDYEKIYSAAPLFLKVAMALTLQTTHAVREIYRIKYKIRAPKEGVCGIVWNKEQQPEIVNGHEVFGTLYIHREKVKKSDASFVAIPVTRAIKDIVELSKSDRVHCPYIVHQKPKRTPPNGMSKECTHPYQVVHDRISKEFSKVRDQIGLYANVERALRPSYHEIRGLSARLIEAMGESATARMAHADASTTKIYTGTGEVVWNEVGPLIIRM